MDMPLLQLNHLLHWGVGGIDSKLQTNRINFDLTSCRTVCLYFVTHNKMLTGPTLLQVSLISI